MVVTAKCIKEAWDSMSCVLYKPGCGPLPDGLYEIERDGPLSKLKTGEGKSARYVFEFDRNAGPDDKPHDYTCEKCGKKCKTLNELGTHTRSEHKDVIVVEPDDDGEEVDLSDRTCTVCHPPKVLKTPYGLRLHTEKSHPSVPAAVPHEGAVEQAA